MKLTRWLLMFTLAGTLAVFAYTKYDSSEEDCTTYHVGSWVTGHYHCLQGWPFVAPQGQDNAYVTAVARRDWWNHGSTYSRKSHYTSECTWPVGYATGRTCSWGHWTWTALEIHSSEDWVQLSND